MNTAGVVARVESLRGRMSEGGGRRRGGRVEPSRGCLRVCWRRRSMGRGTVPVPRATGRRPYAGVMATEGSVESLPLALTGLFSRFAKMKSAVNVNENLNPCQLRQGL
jgi:hypothetical protein